MNAGAPRAANERTRDDRRDAGPRRRDRERVDDAEHGKTVECHWISPVVVPCNVPMVLVAG